MTKIRKSFKKKRRSLKPPRFVVTIEKNKPKINSIDTS
jgi:hypothetical protein